MRPRGLRIPTNHGKGASNCRKRNRALRQHLFDAQSGKCHWCGNLMEMNPVRITSSGTAKENPAYATFEHVVAKAMEGALTADNIVLAHLRCNRRRSRHYYAWRVFSAAGQLLSSLDTTFSSEKGG